MSKKDEKKGKGKAKKAEVEVEKIRGRDRKVDDLPKELYKNKDVGPLLSQLRDREGNAKLIRKQLRKKGFYLTEEGSWKDFIKTKSKAKK